MGCLRSSFQFWIKLKFPVLGSRKNNIWWMVCLDKVVGLQGQASHVSIPKFYLWCRGKNRGQQEKPNHPPEPIIHSGELDRIWISGTDLNYNFMRYGSRVVSGICNSVPFNSPLYWTDVDSDICGFLPILLGIGLGSQRWRIDLFILHRFNWRVLSTT